MLLKVYVLLCVQVKLIVVPKRFGLHVEDSCILRNHNQVFLWLLPLPLKKECGVANLCLRRTPITSVIDEKEH